MEYRVLGPLEIREGNRSLPLASPKQRALLALLLLNANRVVSRERLIDSLWGEEPPEQVIKAVQVYVSRLRKLLPAGALVTQAPGYLLRVGPPDKLDLEQFERLRAQGRLREALALWRGPPLAEFDEPFARAESGRLDDLRLATLEERIDIDLAAARHAELVGELAALIAEHPNRERLRAQLMLALYRSGRHADALAAYREARESLDDFGLEPSAALRELEKAILVQDTALAAPMQLVEEAPPLPGPLRTTSQFPLVGRSRELELLRTQLLRAEAGEGGRVAVIGGEAGGGKTRLARELAHEARERGTFVLYGTSDAVVSTPYQPFVEALGFLVRASEPQALDTFLGNSRGELARLLPELGPPPAPLGDDPDTARRQLHSAIIDLLIRISRERPLLIVVDDIHSADAPSVQLLRQLIQAAPEARMLVLTMFRDRSEDISAELTAVLADLSRLEGVTRIALRALSDGDIAEFIERSSGSPAAVDLTEKISELTEGTPFLICELWRSLVDAGTIESESGVTLARSLAELPSPESVRDVVRYRLSRLAAATTAMLEVAAVAGTEFELSLLGDERALIAAAEEAIASGMIELISEPGVAHRFSHELVRRALYERLSSVRRAELHLRVGEALERTHADNLDRIIHDLAHHFTLAATLGGVDRAIQYNVRAAEAAIRSLAFGDATTRFAAALDLGVANRGQRARIELDLGIALIHAGRVEEAEPRLAEAIEDALRVEDDGLRSHATITRNHARLRIDATAGSDETRAVAEDAIDTFTRLGDRGGLAQAWRLLGRANARDGSWGAATKAFEVALEHAQSAEERREFQPLVNNLITGLYYGPTPALDAIVRCEEVLAEHGKDRYIDAVAACGLAGLFAMTGRFEDARAAGMRGIALLDELNLPVSAGHMRAYVADAALISGDAPAAERELATGYRLLEKAGDQAGVVSTAYDLAWMLCAQRRYADAEDWAVRGRHALEACDFMTRVIGLASEAELAAHAGDVAAAERLARRAVDVADGMDAPNIGAAAYVSLSRILGLVGRSEEAYTARTAAVGLYQAKGNVAAAVPLLESDGSGVPA